MQEPLFETTIRIYSGSLVSAEQIQLWLGHTTRWWEEELRKARVARYGVAGSYKYRADEVRMFYEAKYRFGQQETESTNS